MLRVVVRIHLARGERDRERYGNGVESVGVSENFVWK